MTGTAARRRTVIMGAAGRDFHNFNVVYRNDPASEVVAFTATQIPGIAGRRYPPELAGPLYPDGIPIVDEAELEAVCRGAAVDRVVFAYSDVTHETVMHAASRALACGADFVLLGPRRTMLASAKPVIAISAIRTGCGKSQTCRWLAARLRDRGLRVTAIRHPMPYGDLARQGVQRFASAADLKAADCTQEEREEYAPHIAVGGVVFAGVDYAEILQAAEAETDLLIWEGGNNDFPFLRPDLHVVLTDALRPGQARTHHPGEAVLRMADAIVVAKADAAQPDEVKRVAAEARALNPEAPIVRGASPVSLDKPEAVRGKRVLVVEDGPTITHGGLPHGAGFVAARQAEAAEIVDPRPFAPALLQDIFRRYPHIGPVLPAVGYNAAQREALRETIAKADADVVVLATPGDLAAVIRIDRPVAHATYDFAELESPGLGGIVDAFLNRLGLSP